MRALEGRLGLLRRTWAAAIATIGSAARLLTDAAPGSATAGVSLAVTIAALRGLETAGLSSARERDAAQALLTRSRASLRTAMATLAAESAGLQPGSAGLRALERLRSASLVVSSTRSRLSALAEATIMATAEQDVARQALATCSHG